MGTMSITSDNTTGLLSVFAHNLIVKPLVNGGGMRKFIEIQLNNTPEHQFSFWITG